MKPLFVLLAATSLTTATVRAQTGVGIGTTTPAASAVLDISSSNRGLLLPRLTTAEINAIPTPEEGLVVYNKSAFQFWGYQRYDSLVAKTGAANYSIPLSQITPIVGQSFTVPVATRLTAVDLELANASNLALSVKVDLFTGLGYGGTVVGTDTVEVPANTPVGTLFNVPVPETAVTAGSIFSLRMNCYACAPNTYIVSVGALVDPTPNNADQYTGGVRLNAAGAPIGPVPIDVRFQAHGFVIGWQALENKAVVR